jgi:hypothetical protein
VDALELGLVLATDSRCPNENSAKMQSPRTKNKKCFGLKNTAGIYAFILKNKADCYFFKYLMARYLLKHSF